MITMISNSMEKAANFANDLIHLKPLFTQQQQNDDVDTGKQVLILGEIVGATNLVAAKRDQEVRKNSHAPAAAAATNHHQNKIDHVNAYCEVYWGDIQVHQTKVIKKNNNPIWSCDTGALFLLRVNERQLKKNFCLRVEVHDMVSKKQCESIGEVHLQGENLINERWCDEKRRTFELIKDTKEEEQSKESNNNLWFFLPRNDFFENITTALSAPISWLDQNTNSDHEIDDDDSLYGRSVTSRFSQDNDADNQAEIDDDFVFGKTGTLALRFRTANDDDVQFLKAIGMFDRGYKYAKRKSKYQILAGVKETFNGKLLAPLITERNTSTLKICSCNEIQHFIDFTMHRNDLDTLGMKRIRVKPGPNPQRSQTTEFLTESEMIDYANSPSKKWVEAGSGMLGRVYVEVISCEGLKNNKKIEKLVRKKTDPFICLIYEDCLVETDVIKNCNNPLFMPWTQRAFVFNTMSSLSSLYLGVFDYDYGPFQHKGLGRVTVDLRELKPRTTYTLKYNLYSSPVTSVRKPKGTITIRVQVDTFSEKQSLMATIIPPVVHVNVKRRKTLAVARYTCYGKYREDVYNMKIFRAYIDEILECIELLSYELSYVFDSLFFWRGQVSIGGREFPLYSVLAYLSTIYVIERPRLIPSYICFCLASIFLLILNTRSSCPSPLYRTKSFMFHLKSLLLPSSQTQQEDDQTINPHEGIQEIQVRNLKKKKMIEANKRLKNRIAHVRREMQQILAALSDLSLDTSENSGYNPLSRLLPVQLILRDIMYYIRLVKSLICCDDSAISFLLISCCMLLGITFMLIPFGFLFHWSFRIFVWVCMGPWMRLAETSAVTNESTRQIQRIMEEIKHREQKRLIEARINKEEAMKLKATRIMRFGRFAIKIPFTNIIRYRDQPLSDSFAGTSKLGHCDAFTSTRSIMSVTHYIPGQKHYGVMIPKFQSTMRKLSKPLLKNNREKQVHFSFQDRKQIQYLKTDAKSNYTDGNDLHLSLSCSTEQEKEKLKWESLNASNLIIEAKESMEDNEQGFELIPLFRKISKSSSRQNNSSRSMKAIEDKNYERLEKECTESNVEIDNLPPSSEGCFNSIKIHQVFSDLTDDIPINEYEKDL